MILRFLLSALVLLAFLPVGAQQSPVFQTKDPLSCSLHGEFAQAVFSALGRERALTQSGFGLVVMRNDGETILCNEFVNASKNIYPASTIKTLIALALMRKVDKGAVSLNDVVTITQSNAAQECSPRDCEVYGPGKSIKVGRLLFDMITISNNIAANQLIDIAGRDFINQTADLVGANGLRVFRKVYNNVDPEPWITTPNMANAISYVQLYREIATGRLHVLSNRARGILIGVLGQQKINGSLNGLFPQGFKFWHKTGNTSKVTGDGGFYTLGRKTIVILVGLQDFREFDVCDDFENCVKRTGFQSLALTGKAALDITLSFPTEDSSLAGF